MGTPLLEELEAAGSCRFGSLDGTWPDGPEEPVRDVLAQDGWARDLANGPVTEAARALLGPDTRAVRANLFIKSEATNWFVPWHQDRAVCVADRHDTPGFDGWTIKGGLPHANAPFEVLSQMLAIRLHLDPCPDDAGALEVLPGTHRSVLSTETIADARGTPTTITARRGEVLAMRPLLLHRSPRMTVPTSRRILHVEFAAEPLPTPLRWHYG